MRIKNGRLVGGGFEHVFKGTAKRNPAAKRDLTIELGRGMTYSNNKFTVYEHGVYERHSVLAGQPKRTFVESFDTLEEAKKEYPRAKVIEGSTYHAPDLSHLPDDDDDY